MKLMFTFFFKPSPSSSAWIKVEQLKPYHPHKDEMIKINKGKRFQQAVDAVEEYLKKAKGKEQVSSSARAHRAQSSLCDPKRITNTISHFTWKDVSLYSATENIGSNHNGDAGTHRRESEMF